MKSSCCMLHPPPNPLPSRAGEHIWKSFAITSDDKVFNHTCFSLRTKNSEFITINGIPNVLESRPTHLRSVTSDPEPKQPHAVEVCPNVQESKPNPPFYAPNDQGSNGLLDKKVVQALPLEVRVVWFSLQEAVGNPIKG